MFMLNCPRELGGGNACPGTNDETSESDNIGYNKDVRGFQSS